MTSQVILTPRPMKAGDKIAIVSPSGIVKSELVNDAAEVLSAQGWRPYIGANAFNRFITYAGTDDERYSDLEKALLDPSTRAILCSRGGYGAVHLLERLDRLPLRDDPKWIIGYSDISALHALMNRHGIKSIHAPMARHLSNFKGEDIYSQRLFEILSGKNRRVETPSHSLNRLGTAKGTLVGGNLAVLSGLFSTPFDPVKPGTILFIEDIAEPIYKIERMLYSLKLSGVLGKLSGLIVGQFTDYAVDVASRTMEEMIAEMTADYSYPIVFNFSVGHVDENTPMIVSSSAELTVSHAGVTLRQT